MAKNQKTLFGEWWEKEWQNMPEFVQENQDPFQSIVVHFATEADRNQFAKIFEQKITAKTKYIWYPKADSRAYYNKRYIQRKTKDIQHVK